MRTPRVEGADVKRNVMSVQAFRDEGWLFGVNRILLHPCGVALSIESRADRETGESFAMKFGEILDYRDDPEGIAFNESELGDLQVRQTAAFLQAYWAKREARMERLGYFIQPIEGEDCWFAHSEPPLPVVDHRVPLEAVRRSIHEQLQYQAQLTWGGDAAENALAKLTGDEQRELDRILLKLQDFAEGDR